MGKSPLSDVSEDLDLVGSRTGPCCNVSETPSRVKTLNGTVTWPSAQRRIAVRMHSKICSIAASLMPVTLTVTRVIPMDPEPGVE